MGGRPSLVEPPVPGPRLAAVTGGQGLSGFLGERRAAAEREFARMADALVADHEDALARGDAAVSRFVTPLIVEKVGRKKWRLLAPLVYYSAILQRLRTTKAGKVTDFASVPRLALSYALFGNTAHEPAAQHDDDYETGLLPRRLADLIFREAVTAECTWTRTDPDGPEPWWRARAMYRGVRGFGWLFFRRQVDDADR